MNISYPLTDRINQTDNYHGVNITDPYRWLEDDMAPEVSAWVKEQNLVTANYLSQIPYRQKIADRLSSLMNYARYSSPFRAGDYYFFYKNDGLQNQAVIYFQKGLDGEPAVFIDPNDYSKEGTTAINLLSFSEDNKYVAYAIAEAGLDWQEIHLMEIATQKKCTDVIKWVKFSGASWYKDGIFYSRYPAPNGSSKRTGKNKNHQVYYHQLGTDQSEDILIYEDAEHPDYNHYTYITEDKQYLLLNATPGTDGFSTYYKKLGTTDSFTLLFPGTNHKSYIIDHKEGKFWVLTDIGAPKYRLVLIDLAKPDQENWEEILPECEDLLQTVTTGGGKLFANYLKDATDRYIQMEYDGSKQQEIKLPGLGSAGGFRGKKEDKILFYTFTSFMYPNTIFKYDIASGVSTPFFVADLQFSPSDYEERQVFYKSKDGTSIPMFLVHKKGLLLDGNNPTYLYAYGGFNISLTPSFSSTRLILLENGGVFAMPNLRGGGEYGEEWHRAGMLEKKQNVFDDFIAAANYLIEEKYTSSSKLAIAGGSNGGLLVGACMTQQPLLFQVAFPAVGVLDMLRFHLFTIGRAWIPEYGSSSDPAQFKVLYAYSPLHCLKEGVSYPATLITTGDHDDRVVPAHSFKFAAQLQYVQQGENPVLIRIETDAGHGAGTPISKIIEEQADRWAFFFYNTNGVVIY
ncbi:MAG: prolyl oligopeptidase family serine peptidase [Saprospiraceae bacterium]